MDKICHQNAAPRDSRGFGRRGTGRRGRGSGRGSMRRVGARRGNELNTIWDKRDNDTPFLREHAKAVRAKLAEQELGEGSNPRCQILREIKRHRVCRRLRSKLHSACVKAGLQEGAPLLSFERWLARGMLVGVQERQCARDEGEGAGIIDPAAPRDPLLPPGGPWLDNGFQRDLERAGLDSDAARRIVERLSVLAADGAKEIAKAGTEWGIEGSRSREGSNQADRDKSVGRDEGKKEGSTTTLKNLVVITRRRTTVEVAYEEVGRKPYGLINVSHFEKLEALFKRAHGGQMDEARFAVALFCLLLRYESLQGAGFQAAVPAGGFGELNQRLGVSLECFASPLNSRWARFASAFPDTDAAFGSVGSFFDLPLVEGSFQANPPYVPEVMESMALRIEVLLAGRTRRRIGNDEDGSDGKGQEALVEGEGGEDDRRGALSFCIVVPVWRECRFWGLLERSRFLSGPPLVCEAKDHGFCDGNQHSKSWKDRHRPSSFDTAFFFLQNKAGALSYPVDDDLRVALAAAVAAASQPGVSIQDYEARNKRPRHQ